MDMGRSYESAISMYPIPKVMNKYYDRSTGHFNYKSDLRVGLALENGDHALRAVRLNAVHKSDAEVSWSEFSEGLFDDYLEAMKKISDLELWVVAGPKAIPHVNSKMKMLPQELKEMNQDEQIVLMEYTKPILCEKIQYYDDPLFIPRVLPPAFVPSIDIAKYQSSLRKMIRTLALADVDLEKKSLKRTSDRDQLEIMTQTPPNRRITPKDAAKELVPFSQFYAKTAGIDFGDLRSKPSPISRKASLDESRQILDGQNLGQGTVLQDFLAQIDAGQDASLISLAKRGVSPFEADAAFEGV
jgi:hypothetical protein